MPAALRTDAVSVTASLGRPSTGVTAIVSPAVESPGSVQNPGVEVLDSPSDTYSTRTPASVTSSGNAQRMPGGRSSGTADPPLQARPLRPLGTVE